jgi:hypothetical protein
VNAARLVHYAHCPVEGCGRRLPVNPPPPGRVPNHAAPKFPTHRHPAGGNCKGSHGLVLLAHREHRCVRCRLLPLPQPGDYDQPGHRVGVHSRPPEPRPIDKRSPANNPHCTSHWRDVLEERRKARSAGRRRSTHGISDELAALVLAEQGGGCACGRPFSKTYTPRTDHHHPTAREVCDHPENVACPRCYRGGLHDACNVAIGRFTAEQLENLAAYLRNPTTARIIAGPEPADPTFAAGYRELVAARGGARLDRLRGGDHQ